LHRLKLNSKNIWSWRREKEEGAGGEGEKRCEVWRLQVNKTLMYIEVEFSYCKGLQKDRKDGNNIRR
jgi:hypothetical protein